MNLILSQTEDKQLINVSAARPKSDGPFHSNLEKQPELKKKQDKLHLQWPPIKETQQVVNRTLGLYQHGQQHKAGSSSSQWPPPTVENPWDKEFTPKDFPTRHKIPSTLSKRWELHEDSPLMLKPPTSMAVDQVPDSEIAKCSSCLEAFAAHSAHSASISSTSLEAVYTLLQKVVMFLCSSAVQDSVKNDATCLDDLLQRANSTVLEAQLMSHDAGVTATELYTHLHMFRRRTVLESPSGDLPQRDTDRLIIMSLVRTSLVLTPARSRNGKRIRRRRKWIWSLMFSRNVRVGKRLPERRLLQHVRQDHFHTSLPWTLSILLRPRIPNNVLRANPFGETPTSNLPFGPDLL